MSSTTLEVRVAARRLAADDIVEIELVPVAGGELPAFEAGAHIDLHLGAGLVRQYSLHNDPRERHRWCIGVLKDAASRGGSEAVHRDLHEGRSLTVGLPRNHFPLQADEADSVLVAGGIGITPLLAMARALQAQGRRFALHYCARSRRRAAFADAIAASDLAPHSFFHFDDEGGRLSMAHALEGRPGARVYICGPSGFIEWARGEAAAHGVPAGRIHVEHFGAEVPTEGGAFTVVAQRSGLTLQVGEKDTIAQVLLAAGVRVELSCEQGVCGTCLTRVVEGTPDHRDLYQSDEEKAANEQLTVCCSRSCSARLVLDI
jgi:vanillate monooxygenase ferredoxin subunit